MSFDSCWVCEQEVTIGDLIWPPASVQLASHAPPTLNKNPQKLGWGKFPFNFKECVLSHYPAIRVSPGLNLQNNNLVVEILDILLGTKSSRWKLLQNCNHHCRQHNHNVYFWKPIETGDVNLIICWPQMIGKILKMCQMPSRCKVPFAKSLCE